MSRNKNNKLGVEKEKLMEMLDRTERLKNRLIQILREIEEAEDALEDTSTPDNVKHFYQGQLTEWRENYYNLQKKLQAS